MTKTGIQYGFLAVLLLCVLVEPALAQDGSAGTAVQSQVEMADGLRASGKIYVVVGVILILLAGLLAYLVSLDRKIGRLERELDQDAQRH